MSRDPEMKPKQLTLYEAGDERDEYTVGAHLVIPGDAITELVMLPSGFPMVTFKHRDGSVARVGGFRFRFDLEPPSLVQPVGALPPNFPRAS